jgi:DNA-binding CsgD family transcriptional regulator
MSPSDVVRVRWQSAEHREDSHISPIGVKTLFTAPAAFRAIKKEDPGGELARKHDLSGFRYLFLAGERLDPETFRWASDLLGIPVIDHWWQTETEEVLASHPVVAECAVIGVHDDLKGQIPRGFVVLKAGIAADPAALSAELVAVQAELSLQQATAREQELELAVLRERQCMATQLHSSVAQMVKYGRAGPQRAAGLHTPIEPTAGRAGVRGAAGRRSNRAIARQLRLSESTVKANVSKDL